MENRMEIPLTTLVNSAIISTDQAELCNGSTTDSDSVCLGSNPSSAANEINRLTTAFAIARRFLLA